ncbi:MAG: hypothetical protein ACREBU_07450 [Nitrososphaera sp.]
MTKRRKRAKSSRASNLARRIVQIANDLAQARHDSPVFMVVNGKLKKLTQEQPPDYSVN